MAFSKANFTFLPLPCLEAQHWKGAEGLVSNVDERNCVSIKHVGLRKATCVLILFHDKSIRLGWFHVIQGVLSFDPYEIISCSLKNWSPRNLLICQKISFL